MSLSRRIAPLEGADRERVWIIEDDYDSEYRYAMRPFACLQGTEHGERVIYIGTFSTVLFRIAPHWLHCHSQRFGSGFHRC
jgi:GntR family transcriptional regulator/MocR family aminotransferase